MAEQKTSRRKSRIGRLLRKYQDKKPTPSPRESMDPRVGSSSNTGYNTGVNPNAPPPPEAYAPGYGPNAVTAPVVPPTPQVTSTQPTYQAPSLYTPGYGASAAPGGDPNNPPDPPPNLPPPTVPIPQPGENLPGQQQPPGGPAQPGAGFAWPAPFLDAINELRRGAVMDRSGQGFDLWYDIQNTLQGLPFQNYLDTLYSGVLGVNMTLPQIPVASALSAINADTLNPDGPVSSSTTTTTGGGYGGGSTGGMYGGGVVGPNYGGGGQALENNYPYRMPGGISGLGDRKRIGANMEWGMNLEDQGYKNEKGMGKKLFFEHEQKKKYGVFANQTWNYQVGPDGKLYKKAKPKQEGRIAAGYGDWKLADEHEQRSFQNQTRQRFFKDKPDASWSDYVMNKGLWKHVKGGSVFPHPTHPGWFTNAGGELWDSNGRKLNMSGTGFEGDEPDSPQYPPGYTPGGGSGGGGGQGGGSGTVSGQNLPNFLASVPGGGWSQSTAAFNPNNANTWGLMAPAAAGIAGDLDAMRKNLRGSLSGGALEAATSDAVRESYGRIAGLRQQEMQNALDYFGKRAAGKPELFTPQRSASESGGLQNAYRSDTLNYQLGQDQIKAQKDAAKRGFWGSVMGALGGVVSNIPGFSDPAVKTDVAPHKEGLSAIKALSTYDWTYNEKVPALKGKKASGVMATDLEKVIPSAVTVDPETNFKMVDYSAVLASSVNAIKELDEKIERLKRLREKK